MADPWSLAGSVVTAAGNLASSALTGYYQTKLSQDANNLKKDQFEQSMSFQRQQAAYQQYAAEHAYQTAVSDAEAAGLSPLAVLEAGTSGATSASTVSLPSVPDYNTPDLNTFVDGVRAASDTIMQGILEHGRNERNSSDNQSKLEAINLQLNATKQLADSNNAHEFALFLAQSEDQDFRDSFKAAQEQNDSLMDSIKVATGGKFTYFNTYYGDSEKEAFLEAKSNWVKKVNNLYTQLLDSKDFESESVSTSSSENSSKSFGGSVGAGHVFDLGGNTSSSSGSSSSESHSSSASYSTANQAAIAKMMMEAGPFPLWLPKRK